MGWAGENAPNVAQKFVITAGTMRRRITMAKKGNIRSIRFSDELAALIDQQIGDTFTAKFESLITKCVWELPKKEKELERLDEQIRRKQGQLLSMSEQVRQLERTINDLFPTIQLLKAGIDRAVQKWDV